MSKAATEALVRFQRSGYWIVLVLATILLVFSVLRYDEFTSIPNLRNVSIDLSALLIMAVGATYVLITAGVDLSVGSILVFSSVVAAKLMDSIGGTGWGVVLLGLTVALAAGLAWGIVNGVLIAKGQIPPLIATLGTLGMALGLALVITDGIDIRGVPDKLDEFGTGRLFGEIPYLVIVALGVAVVGGIFLASTRFGRYTYAIGSNPEAARREGVRVERHLIKVYALSGTLAGLAGFISLAQFGTTTVSGHSTDILQVIAGVVLGGTSLFGGIGTMFGTVIGMLIPAFLQNGFVIVGVKPFWQQVAIGAVLIIAVYFDQLRRRARYSS